MGPCIHLPNPLSDFAIMLQQYNSLPMRATRSERLQVIVWRVSDKSESPFFEGLPTRAFEQFIMFQTYAPAASTREVS